MKRKCLSGSSKRKQKEIRLRNEEKGKRTLEQLNWGKTVSLDSPSELTTTEEEDVQIEESAEESNTLEHLTITNKPAFDEITATSIAPTSRSDVGNSANATVTDVHSTSTSSDSSVQISNDVGRWKSLSESERDCNLNRTATTTEEPTKGQQGQIISDEHIFKKNAQWRDSS